MNDQIGNLLWWQRPQPVWVSTLLSTLVLLALFGLWNIIQQGGSAFEGDTTTLETSQSATAQSTGGTVPYQGFVSNANGQPLNGNQTMSFALYAVSTGGTAVWGPETHTNIPVVEGLFSAVLGSKTTGGIPNSVWENGSLYVQITINGEALTPREPIFATPMPKSLQLLGVKTAGKTTVPSLPVGIGWHPVRGTSDTDYIEVTTPIQGGLVHINMTTRYQTTTPSLKWCGIAIYDETQTLVHRVHLDGSASLSIDYGCSGSHIVSLPQGTYTFQAITFTDGNTTMTWDWERQISVFEYR